MTKLNKCKEQFPDIQQLYESNIAREQTFKKSEKDLPYVYTGSKPKYEKMRKDPLERLEKFHIDENGKNIIRVKGNLPLHMVEDRN